MSNGSLLLISNSNVSCTAYIKRIDILKENLKHFCETQRKIYIIIY